MRYFEKMFDLRFNSIRVFFTLCFFVVLEITKAQTPTTGTPQGAPQGVSSSSSSSSSSTGTSYYTIINQGEIGISMQFTSGINTKMSVAIFYDTETTTATDFFRNQFKNDVFTGFTACGVIDWKFLPCGTSGLDSNNVLQCPKGDQQCKFDIVHSCVATLSAQDQQKVGQFIICFFTNNKDVNNCIQQIGLVQNDVEQCVKNDGAAQCDSFFKSIHPRETPLLGGSTGRASSEGTTNFKGVLCDHLNNAGLQCTSMCPTNSG